MEKVKWILATILVFSIGVVAFAGCTPEKMILEGVEGININNQQQGISVSGNGKVFAAPDIISLRIGIEAIESTITEAQEQATQAMNDVLAALEANGVAEKDIQTQYFNIRQETRWDRDTEEEVVIGYRVTNMVSAKIREIDKAGTIIDAVAVAGGDYTRVDNINFSIDDPSDYYDDAREEAIADAKAKAEQLANLAGVKLGKPNFISESTYTAPIATPRIAMEFAEQAAGMETPISPGEMEISANVQITYSITE